MTDETVTPARTGRNAIPPCRSCGKPVHAAPLAVPRSSEPVTNSDGKAVENPPYPPYCDRCAASTRRRPRRRPTTGPDLFSAAHDRIAGKPPEAAK